MKSALLIIDVQHALCTGDEAAFDIEAVVARINGLSSQARASSVPVVLIQHDEPGGPLQKGTQGWQVYAHVVMSAHDLRVQKTVCNSFQGTDLQVQLQAHGVGRLVVCGLQSNHCVDATVRGALAHGYPVVLVSDAHSTTAQGGQPAAQIIAHHNTTLAGLAQGEAVVTVTPAAAVSLVPGPGMPRRV
jgi:nicotinamidase-related amidase